MLKIYNVLTRKKEEFIPIEKNVVKMYACGITASGDAHIGHAFQAIVFDMIRKYLSYCGYNVIYVRNYTDIDDKIIVRANQLNVNPLKYAHDIMDKIDHEFSKLCINPPTIQSKVTDCMEDIIKAIDILIKKGHAYVSENGDVFFSVSSFPNYGKFSNRNTDFSINGVRNDVEPGKKDDKDFALWKSAKEGEIFWKSPWGNGRPGWHIECSVMSMKYLGHTLDIHGGGKDLIFPHHENEIAQSEALSGHKFSNYWIHNGLIKINGSKMSKSLGNSILIEKLLEEYNYEVIRMTLLQNHYRSDLNVIDGMFEINEQKIYKIYSVLNNCLNLTANLNYDLMSSESIKIKNDFENAMNNDFNTSLAISLLLENINIIDNMLSKKSEHQKALNMSVTLINMYDVLGMLQQNPKDVTYLIKKKYLDKNNISEEEIKLLIEKREKFKLEKNYVDADLIRSELLNKGIIIKDFRDGTKWDVSL